MSPSENKLAIKVDKDGQALAFHQSICPSRDVIEVFETYHKGSAQEILQNACRQFLPQHAEAEIGGS